MSPSALSALTRRPFDGLPAGYTPAPSTRPRRNTRQVRPSGTAGAWVYDCACGASLGGRAAEHGRPGTLANARAKVEVYRATAKHRRDWRHSAWAGLNPEDADAEANRWQGWSD